MEEKIHPQPVENLRKYSHGSEQQGEAVHDRLRRKFCDKVPQGVTPGYLPGSRIRACRQQLSKSVSFFQKAWDICRDFESGPVFSFQIIFSDSFNLSSNSSFSENKSS